MEPLTFSAVRPISISGSTEISSATEEAPFDFSAYDGRVKEIQDAYNEGIDKLKAADEEALKLNED